MALHKSFKILFFVMLVSLVIAFAWNRIPAISATANAVLNPTAGALLNWNTTWGMLIIILIINIVIVLLHKKLTDQETLREIKKEQKALQQEMKLVKDDPAKVMELNKKQMEKMPLIMEASMRPLMYTAIPFIIFFRWFHEFFSVAPFEGFRFFGFFSWFWFYLVFSIIFSSILRKALKVA